MAIKVVSRDEVNEYKLDLEIRQLKEMEVAVVAQMKESLLCLTDLDYLHEIQNYIDDLIREWGDRELETEDCEDDED